MEASFNDILREQLHRLFPEAKEDGAGLNTSINCPLCAREGNPDHNRHLSIHLGYDGKPLLYNCWRNSSHRGLLTSSVLETLARDSTTTPDPAVLEAIDEYNKRIGKVSKYKLTNDSKYRIDTVQASSTELNEIKRLYVCKRIGVDLSIEELVQDKVVFSIRELLQRNYVQKLTRAPQIIDLLDSYFVGFMTNNNGSLILRSMVYGQIDLPESLSKRYVKYSLIQGAQSGYYIIPTQSNIYGHIDVHLAEGTFDILSVFYNLRNANRLNNVYGSIGGNSYASMVEYFLCTVGLVDVTFHIYIDNDINPHVIPEIKKLLQPLTIESYIHFNSKEGEKDFGVPKYQIQECCYRLT